jgi:hypothetical protein
VTPWCPWGVGVVDPDVAEGVSCYFLLSNRRFVMRPSSRHVVNKTRSSKSFSRNTRTVAHANVAGAPMRGGWRL